MVPGKTRRALVAAPLVVSLLALIGPARAQEGPVDLLSQFDIRIDGDGGNEAAGHSVDGGGDVNGDDIPDVVVGAPFADAGINAFTEEGRAYVVFGDPSPRTVDTGNLGTEGFVIEGGEAGARVGNKVAMAGDVNDDDLEDLLVGTAKPLDPNATTYVIFGKATTTPVDVGDLGADGFEINGALNDSAGFSLAGARDVNNDGMADVLIGAPFADPDSRAQAGSTYVIFGKTSTTAVDLASLGAGGFRIDGALAGDLAGYSVSRAGNMNSDGLADIVIGTRSTDNNTRDASGGAYVIFGKATTTTIDLASPGAAGFRIDGAEANHLAGHSVVGLGDVNDDSIGDVAVAAFGAEYNSRPLSGSAYVVFGKGTTDTIDLASLSTGGFRVDGPIADTEVAYRGVGHSMGAPRDVNDDGMNDLVLGLPDLDNNARTMSGSAYVVFGKTSPDTIDLETLEPGDGFRIDGANNVDLAGFSVGWAGDLNDDGFSDVLVGAASKDSDSGLSSGAAYIELVSDWLPGPCANPRSGTDEDDTLIGGVAGDDITGGEGADDLRGEAGDDCVEGDSGADTVKGGENADILEGGDGNDPSIKGGDGNDTLKGEDGEDTLDGGNGLDDLQGGKRDDILEGGDKADTLDGGKGDDTLKGNAGEDSLFGAENADTLKGGDAADTLEGEDGKDTLKGQDGGDTLKGGKGKDTLNGGSGKDTIKSGDGDDVINADDGQKDTINCGKGQDDVDADNKDVLISC